MGAIAAVPSRVNVQPSRYCASPFTRQHQLWRAAWAVPRWARAAEATCRSRGTRVIMVVADDVDADGTADRALAQSRTSGENLSSSDSSWLHFLRSWSLRQTRGGSAGSPGTF